MNTFAAVRACSLAFLAGAVLHACDVTAGNGRLIDWRSVKSGEEIRSGSDACELAQLFVAFVGVETALASIDEEVAPAPEPTPIATRIHAYMQQANGGRLRSFDATAKGFRVQVEAHEDDAAQAAFTAKLAAFCDGLPD